MASSAERIPTHTTPNLQKPENPARVNLRIIPQALETIIPTVPPKEPFDVHTPITLTLRTGEQLPLDLVYNGTYFMYPSNPNIKGFMSVSVGISQKKGTYIASRSWIIRTPDGRPPISEAVSESETKPNWEDNRFGKALLYCNDAVMNHMLDFMKPIWGTFKIAATITDVAEGAQYSRTKWSTDLAKEIGFTQLSNMYELIKMYEK